MALIKCPKCGKEISDKAKKCVGCGWEVDLNVLNEKNNISNLEEVVSCVADSKKDTSHIESEREKMLQETKLEIEKMKEKAKLEIESMNESAKAMAVQKQRELELEYEKKEKELAQKEEFLKKSQKELEQDEIKQVSEQQHTEKVEKKAVFPSVNILFILIPTAIMICFMIMVWIRLNSFLAEIELLASKDQAETELLVDDIENVSDKQLDDIVDEEIQEGYGEVVLEEENSVKKGVPEQNTEKNAAKVGNLDIDPSEHTYSGAIYYLTDATVLEIDEKDNVVKIAVKGEVIQKATTDKLGVYFKFLDDNGFELCHELVYINGDIGSFTESFSKIPNTVASIALK